MQSIFRLARRLASYADKILRGAKPRDLPIEQPTKIDPALDLETAKALGIKIPQSIVVITGADGSDHAKSLQSLHFPSNQSLYPVLDPPFHQQNHASNAAWLQQCRKWRLVLRLEPGV